MPFTAPTFNLTCRIRRWTAGPYPPGGPIAGSVDSPCQLRLYKTAALVVAHLASQEAIALCLPSGTDIRNYDNVNNADLVECPKGSGLWYQVSYVNDVARGFANQYRLAGLLSLHDTPNMWAYPMP